MNGVDRKPAWSFHDAIREIKAALELGIMSSVYGWSVQGRCSRDFAGPHHPACVCLPGRCYCWTNIHFKLSRGQVETQPHRALVSWGVHYLPIVLKCLPDLPFQLRPQNSWTDSHPRKLTLSSDKPQVEGTRPGMSGTAKPVIVPGVREALCLPGVAYGQE